MPDRRWIASPPSRWADEERDFHLAYLQDPNPYPRCEVMASWTILPRHTAAGGHMVGMAVVAAITAAHLANRGNEGPHMTVVRDADGAVMSFSLDNGPALAEWSGTARGVVVGGFGENAITCVELGDLTVWPTHNPMLEQTGRSAD